MIIKDKNWLEANVIDISIDRGIIFMESKIRWADNINISSSLSRDYGIPEKYIGSPIYYVNKHISWYTIIENKYSIYDLIW
jgi:hypothetical protein